MPTWIRVKDKDTGHTYDIAEESFDDNAHQKVNSQQWPDLTEDNERPREPLFRTDKAGSAATPKKES